MRDAMLMLMLMPCRVLFEQAYPGWREARERTKAHFRSPYKGGFEDEMTRREAALILGVRYV